MQKLWGEPYRIGQWRRVWLALAESEQELGLDIPDAALAELAETEPGTSIVWTTRGEALTRVFGGGAADALPARGALGASLR
ncbi:MAG TPA: hypothetical protein PKL41_13615, partial [Flavobacteriales bacterium]|nr:hypothetical protein [Flavobacteriales bacterium]